MFTPEKIKIKSCNVIDVVVGWCVIIACIDPESTRLPTAKVGTVAQRFMTIN